MTQNSAGAGRSPAVQSGSPADACGSRPAMHRRRAGPSISAGACHRPRRAQSRTVPTTACFIKPSARLRPIQQLHRRRPLGISRRGTGRRAGSLPARRRSQVLAKRRQARRRASSKQPRAPPASSGCSDVDHHGGAAPACGIARRPTPRGTGAGIDEWRRGSGGWWGERQESRRGVPFQEAADGPSHQRASRKAVRDSRPFGRTGWVRQLGNRLGRSPQIT